MIKKTLLITASILFCISTTACSAESLRLTNDNYADSLPVISPNGKSVAYISNRDGKRKLILLDIKTKKQTELAKKLDKRSPAAWSPDSKTIAFTTKKITKRILNIVNIDAKKVEVICKGKFPQFSNNGKYIAFVNRKDALHYNVKAKKVTNLTKFESRNVLETPVWSKDDKVIYYCKNGDLWSVAINGSKNKMVLSHFLNGTDSVMPFSSLYMDNSLNRIYMTLITDGLFAHVTDNIFAYYDIKTKKLTRISEGNNWAVNRDGKSAIMNLGNMLYKVNLNNNQKTELTKGAYPSFSKTGKLIYLTRKDMLEEFDIFEF
jgi:Tol biopolymer transport system component